MVGAVIEDRKYGDNCCCSGHVLIAGFRIAGEAPPSDPSARALRRQSSAASETSGRRAEGLWSRRTDTGATEDCRGTGGLGRGRQRKNKTVAAMSSSPAFQVAGEAPPSGPSARASGRRAEGLWSRRTDTGATEISPRMGAGSGRQGKNKGR